MIGTRLGPYQITAKLGEGGMGEVYRATDSRLGREVAIKVLPENVAQDPERLARFEREAKILASLNHNNIATIHGIEEGGSAPALVMELVEGPTLADRIAQGPVSLGEALPIAKQIAEGLEYAHERGIVHRDLKPANIKLTAEGQVKILDFGLAKALEVDTASAVAPDLSHSPTLAYQATVQGVILGTAAYMSPEQAAGKPVDKRSDIWAFGVVLYEMLSAARLFTGDSAAETLAGVLKGAIDLDSLPAETPAAIRRLLRLCLERNPKNRLHDIADARIAIDDVLSGEVEDDREPSSGKQNAWTRAAPWLLVAALVAVVGWLGWIRGGPKQTTGPRALEISLPPGYLLNAEAAPALAPDGSALVFGASDATHGTRLFLRRLDRFDVTPLEGTEGATFPFWSPDSKSIAFYRDFGLLRYDLATRSTQVILKTGALPRGGSWAKDGTILFAPSANSPIQRIPAAGGSPRDVTKLDPSILDGSHRYPVFLPDGKRFLLTIWSNNLKTASEVGGIYLASLDKGIERRLTPDHSEAILTGDRLLVYREGDLVALPFDPDTAKVEGAGEIVSEDVLYSSSSGALAASASTAGDLAFVISSGEGSGELAWLDRQGKVTGRLAVERMAMDHLALAPDGRHFVILREGASGGDVWVGDSERQIVARLTRGTSDSFNPVWSPDGRQIAFSNETTGQQSVYVQPADGSQAAQLLLSVPKYDLVPTDWAADGRYLFIDAIDKESQKGEIWLYDFEKQSGDSLLADPSASLGDGTLSPDGRWLAYTSDESGNPEVFVRPYPALDRKWQVSQGGAAAPHWRSDSRELVFISTSDRSVLAISVEPENDGLSFGAPETLFTPQSPLLALAPSPDHSRFLAGIVPGDVRSEPIHLILGWSAKSIGSVR